MEKIISIEESACNPQIILDPTGRISFKGKSLMEDASKFYKQIHDWVNELLSKNSLPIVVDFQLIYFNSSSAKQILKLLMSLDDSDIDCKVIWKYPKDHDILQGRGTELELMLDLSFEYVSV